MGEFDLATRLSLLTPLYSLLGTSPCLKIHLHHRSAPNCHQAKDGRPRIPDQAAGRPPRPVHRMTERWVISADYTELQVVEAQEALA